MIPEESRAELHSTRLAYLQLILWTLMGVTAIIGYLFRYGTGNKLLEQPLPHKIVIVICMLIFLYNVGMTIRKARRFTTTEAVLMIGFVSAALLYLPALLHYENYTVSIFYRWWTIHLWVEGVWMMIMGGFLAYLLIRLSGADREVMEKWLYVIVGLVFIAGILGTAHHYYWVGVPSYWLPIGGLFSALEPLALVGMAAYAYGAIRRSGLAHPNTLALHWTIGSAVFSLFGAGLLGLAHTWPSVNKWTHGTLITAMHGHAAFYGLRDDRPGDDHLRAACADVGTARAGQQFGLLGILAADQRHVRHDAVVRHRGDCAGLPGADHGNGLSGCTA